MVQHEILNYILVGKENAITRKELEIKTGMTDRQVREAIAEARRDVTILNDQDGKGYYVPVYGIDNDRVKRYVKQEEARAKSIFCNLKGAREFLKNKY